MSALDPHEAPVRVAVVGLRGHAGRHIQRLLDEPGCEVSAVYYPGQVRDEDEALPVTNNFERCLDSDAVIISSPTSVHADQLLQLAEYPGYVLLEKPAAADKGQIASLLQLPRDLKERVRINYNFQFHAAARRFADLARSDALGDIFALSIHSSHGGAFREDWQGSWRRSGVSEYGPLETVGVHFIQYVAEILGSCDRSWIFRSSMAHGLPEVTDTGLLTMALRNGSWASIQCSYAAPYAFRMELRGTNGWAEYDGQEIRVFSPRATFDDKGRFARPPVTDRWPVDHESAWKRSLEEAQRRFLDAARRKARFNADDFDRDVSIMNVLLNAEDGSRAVS